MIDRVRDVVNKFPGKVGMSTVVKLFEEKMKERRRKHGLEKQFPGTMLVFGYKRGEAVIYDVEEGEYLKVHEKWEYGCGSGYQFADKYLNELVAQQNDLTDNEIVDRLLASQAVVSTYDMCSRAYVSVLGL